MRLLRGRLAFIGAAAAAVMVTEAAALVALKSPEGAGRCATATARSTSAGALALIGFAPDAPSMSLAPSSPHASPRSSGSAGGLYKVRFGDKALSKDEMDALIRELRATPLVTSALPAGG